MKALITGASSGLGKIFAEELAKQGYSLVLVARREENLKQIKTDLLKKYKTSVEYIVQDLSKKEGIERVFKNEPNVDLLINNAGFGVIGEFINSDLGREEEMLDLNMKSLTLFTKLYAQKMAKRKSGGIINVASTASFQPVPYMALYSATKAFVLSFTEAISYELANTGVHVMALCPGPTKTEFFSTATKGSNNSSGEVLSLMEPEEVVKQCLADFKKKRRVSIAGLKNSLMVFSTRFAPRNTVLNIAGKMMQK